MPNKFRPFKLPPKVKATWLKALRSGKFKQGEGQLKENVTTLDDTTQKYEYCCLGVAVACGLARPRKGETSSYVEEKFLPERIQTALANRNDGFGKCPITGKEIETTWSFKQIANWIEKNL